MARMQQQYLLSELRLVTESAEIADVGLSLGASDMTGITDEDCRKMKQGGH